MIIYHLGQTTLTALKTLNNVLQLREGGTDFGSILKTVWKICWHTFMDPFSVEKDSGGRFHFLTPEARTPTLHFPPMSSLLCCFWYDLSLRCLSLQATWGWLLDVTKGSLLSHLFKPLAHHRRGVLHTYTHSGVPFKRTRLFSSRKLSY